ncbi:hypothetical protein HPB47_003066 [Ixodes persulcatus]|uniref:Uncharacterized protein n=1 Tax=Ixodes persulcatus TaxID=34615 RepID=A0AC60PJN0_IXOPE|nr:hypothetical protein HPB47_003066 [Ixodes persulcatus]
MVVPKKKSHNNCCVVGCINTYENAPDTRFYSFPSKPYEVERRAAWVRLHQRQVDLRVTRRRSSQRSYPNFVL